ncbi:hypothetical protein ACLB2K_006644 [Fragaria x ananassa]
MEEELKNFIKINPNLLRLISLLPVFYLFITTPLTLHSFHLCGPTIFFLVGPGIFKFLLFSLNLGPLSPPQPSLFHFISIACLPIKIKQNPNPKSTQKPYWSAKQLREQTTFAPVCDLSLVLLPHVFGFRYPPGPERHSGSSSVWVRARTPVRRALPLHFASRLLGPSMESNGHKYPAPKCIQSYPARVVGARWARLPAVMATFAVSGLMHEVIYYYITRVQPTWEVTWFFVLHGVCVVVEVEVEVKKAVTGRWGSHPVVSRPLTLVFLAVTGNWLFFPQLIRNGVDTKAIGEYAITNVVAIWVELEIGKDKQEQHTGVDLPNE